MKGLITLLIISLSFGIYAGGASESAIMPWGADQELISPKVVTAKAPIRLSQKVGASMIKFFQNHISPIDGPRSSYYPTSSQYALEAIQKYGFLKGVAMGCDRLMRENHEEWVYDTTNRHGIERKLDPVR